MKRYQKLVNSNCLGCGEWLCVTAGAYTGDILCPKCGIVNIFSDSLTPREVAPCHGNSESQNDEFVSSK